MAHHAGTATSMIAATSMAGDEGDDRHVAVCARRPRRPPCEMVRQAHQTCLPLFSTPGHPRQPSPSFFPSSYFFPNSGCVGRPKLGPNSSRSTWWARSMLRLRLLRLAVHPARVAPRPAVINVSSRSSGFTSEHLKRRGSSTTASKVCNPSPTRFLQPMLACALIANRP